MLDLSTITETRLSRYIRSGEPRDRAIERYIWNIRLSEAFYPALSMFEIAFRNRIDKAIYTQIDTGWLDENWSKWSPHSVFEKSKIQEAKNKIRNRRKPTRGHLIAELPLGFWIALFNKNCKPLFWQKQGMFESVFPNFNQKKTIDRIGIINPHLDTIRFIRNRISHHEPIFDWSNGLDKAYFNLEALIKWISEDTYETVQSVSRFQEIWENGVSG